MAGLPASVLKRAQVVLRGLEAQQLMAGEVPADSGRPALIFEDPEPDVIHERLMATDPNELTPLEALLLIAELKSISDRQKG